MCIRLTVRSNCGYANLLLLFAFSGLLTPVAYSQQNESELDLIFRGNVGSTTPFWLQYNRYDLISDQPGGQIGVRYQERMHFDGDTRLILGTELYGRTDNAFLDRPIHQVYVGLNYRNLLFTIGKREETVGIVQQEVSAGPTIWSGNAQPMPKIKLELTEFSPLPFTDRWLSVKGGLAHGWFDSDRVVEDFFLHEKYAYLQVGKRPWPRAYVRLIHMAQWGGYDHRSFGQLSDGMDEYWRIFFGREGGEDAEWHSRDNAAGNHLGSWQAGISWSIGQTDLLLNRSTIFEDGTGFTLWSPEDGLWGLNIRQNHTSGARDSGRSLGSGGSSGGIGSSGDVSSGGDGSSYTLFTWEFWHTKSQSGPGANDRPDDWEGDPRYDADGNRFGGRDHYFNHTIYRPGWSYHDRILGVPFITINPETNQIANNRLIAHHLGLKHQEPEWSVTLFYTWTKNYGSYGVPFEEPLIQHHYMLSLEHDLSSLLALPLSIGAELGLDHGDLFGNRFGALFTLAYRVL